MGGRSSTSDSFQSAVSSNAATPHLIYGVGGYIDLETGEIELFVNGVSVAKNSSPTFNSSVFNTGVPDGNPSVGSNLPSGGTQFWQGRIAELSFWDVKLTPAEFLLLGKKRYRPDTIRKENQTSYWDFYPGTGSIERDKLNNYIGTPTVGQSHGSHPNMVYAPNQSKIISDAGQFRGAKLHNYGRWVE